MCIYIPYTLNLPGENKLRGSVIRVRVSKEQSRILQARSAEEAPNRTQHPQPRKAPYSAPTFIIHQLYTPTQCKIPSAMTLCKAKSPTASTRTRSWGGPRGAVFNEPGHPVTQNSEQVRHEQSPPARARPARSVQWARNAPYSATAPLYIYYTPPRPVPENTENVRNDALPTPGSTRTKPTGSSPTSSRGSSPS